jgi:DNA-binding response OmpR family regulator
MNRVLLVSNDEALKKFLTAELTEAGYLLSSGPADTDYETILKENPDLVLIDLSEDLKRAVSFCKELKREEETRDVAVLVLVEEKELGKHDLGETVEDFIIKPCRPGEVVSRIRQIMRRKAPRVSGDSIRIGDLVVDFASYEVLVMGLPISLTFKEYELLKFLVTHPNRVYSRNALLNWVWGYETYVGTRTVDIHIRRLRSKLGNAGSVIQTVRNVGYKFTSEP